MILRSMNITREDIINACPVACELTCRRAQGDDDQASTDGWHVRLTSPTDRSVRHEDYMIFLARLYEIDPHMFCRPYMSRDHFHARTNGAFKIGDSPT